MFNQVPDTFLIPVIHNQINTHLLQSVLTFPDNYWQTLQEHPLAYQNIDPPFPETDLMFKANVLEQDQ